MNALINVSWIQITLVAMGSLLQFLAMCEFARERRALIYRRSHPAPAKVVNTHEQARKIAEQEHLLRAIHAGPKHVTHPHIQHDADHHPIRPGDLLKTAKVTFHQDFGFRDHKS